MKFFLNRKNLLALDTEFSSKSEVLPDLKRSIMLHRVKDAVSPETKPWKFPWQNVAVAYNLNKENYMVLKMLLYVQCCASFLKLVKFAPDNTVYAVAYFLNQIVFRNLFTQTVVNIFMMDQNGDWGPTVLGTVKQRRWSLSQRAYSLNTQELWVKHMWMSLVKNWHSLVNCVLECLLIGAITRE